MLLLLFAVRQYLRFSGSECGCPFTQPHSVSINSCLAQLTMPCTFRICVENKSDMYNHLSIRTCHIVIDTRRWSETAIIPTVNRQQNLSTGVRAGQCPWSCTNECQTAANNLCNGCQTQSEARIHTNNREGGDGVVSEVY